MRQFYPAILLAAAAMISTSADAGVLLVSDGGSAIHHDLSQPGVRHGFTVWRQPTVVQAGRGKENIIRSFGKEVGLRQAADIIVPPTWQVQARVNVNESLNVSWGGKRRWTDLLNQALAGTGISAEVDLQTKTVYLSQPRLAAMN